MRGAGIYMAIFGLAGFILPEFGLQLRILNLFGRSSTAIAGILLAAGIVLFIISFFTASDKNEEKNKEKDDQLEESEG